MSFFLIICPFRHFIIILYFVSRVSNPCVSFFFFQINFQYYMRLNFLLVVFTDRQTQLTLPNEYIQILEVKS